MTLPPFERERISGLRRTGRVRPRRKTRKGQVPEAVLDALWAKIVTTCANGTCIWFAHPAGQGQCSGPLQAAHVYSRTYRQIRWDLGNGMGMCAGHHFFAHRNPVIAGRFYEAVLGREKLDWLWTKAQAKAKVDRAAVRESLKARLKDLEEKQ